LQTLPAPARAAARILLLLSFRACVWWRDHGHPLGNMVPRSVGSYFARGWEYWPQPRVGGVHYPSDVEAGRIEATVLVSAMMARTRFQERFRFRQGGTSQGFGPLALELRLLSNGGPARATLRDNLTIKELNLIRENQLCSRCRPRMIRVKIQPCLHGSVSCHLFHRFARKEAVIRRGLLHNFGRRVSE